MASWIPGQVSHLGYRPGPWLGAHKRQPIDVSLPLALPPFLSLQNELLKSFKSSNSPFTWLVMTLSCSVGGRDCPGHPRPQKSKVLAPSLDGAGLSVSAAPLASHPPLRLRRGLCFCVWTPLVAGSPAGPCCTGCPFPLLLLLPLLPGVLTSYLGQFTEHQCGSAGAELQLPFVGQRANCALPPVGLVH